MKLFRWLANRLGRYEWWIYQMGTILLIVVVILVIGFMAARP